MSRAFSRRGFLAGTTAILGTAACAGAPETSLRPLRRKARLGQGPSPDRLLREAGLSGVIGYAVVDMRSGRLLEEHASAAALPPASTAKAITALYALETLGAEHRFATRVLATGGITNGEVQGDLILAGGGDPTLDTDDLADLARQVKAAGITGVRGEYLVWDRAFPYRRSIDPEQPDHVGYNPSISGLNLNFNRVHFEWRRASGSYNVTMDARSARTRADVQIAQMQVVRRAAPVYDYRDAGSHDAWTVASAALGQGGARWLPVRKPGLYAGEVFAVFARSHGIALKAPRLIASLPGGSTNRLAEVTSERLEDLTRDMLKFSTNLTAEALGMAASAKRAGRPLSLAASAREMTAWTKSDLGMGSNTKFVDHSGLGDASRVTAVDMATSMRAAGQRSALRGLMKDIPMRDANRRIIAKHPVDVDAKTGTLNFVSALAGYATGSDGRELAFAILMADTRRRAGLARAERERPDGGRAYNSAAKVLQQQLLQRWGKVYAHG